MGGNKAQYGFARLIHVPRQDKFKAYLDSVPVGVDPAIAVEIQFAEMRAEGDVPLMVLIDTDPQTNEPRVWGAAAHEYRGWGK